MKVGNGKSAQKIVLIMFRLFTMKNGICETFPVPDLSGPPCNLPQQGVY